MSCCLISLSFLAFPAVKQQLVCSNKPGQSMALFRPFVIKPGKTNQLIWFSLFHLTLEMDIFLKNCQVDERFFIYFFYFLQFFLNDLSDWFLPIPLSAGTVIISFEGFLKPAKGIKRLSYLLNLARILGSQD